MWVKVKPSGELYHHGIKGQRWGVRNYQYQDGSLTPEGKERYNQGTGRKTGSISRRGDGLGTGPVGNGARPGNVQASNSKASQKSYSGYKIEKGAQEKKASITRSNSSQSTSSGNYIGTDFNKYPKNEKVDHGKTKNGYSYQFDSTNNKGYIITGPNRNDPTLHVTDLSPELLNVYADSSSFDDKIESYYAKAKAQYDARQEELMPLKVYNKFEKAVDKINDTINNATLSVNQALQITNTNPVHIPGKLWGISAGNDSGKTGQPARGGKKTSTQTAITKASKAVQNAVSEIGRVSANAVISLKKLFTKKK